MHDAFTQRCQSNMQFKEYTHTQTQMLAKGKKVRKWLVWNIQEVDGLYTQACLVQSHQPRGCVQWGILRSTIPKFSYKNLIISLVGYFWNLISAPIYRVWETSVLIVRWRQKLNPNSMWSDDQYSEAHSVRRSCSKRHRPHCRPS